MKKRKFFAILSFGVLAAGMLVGCNGANVDYGELHPAKAATCETNGNIAYYYANGKYYNEQKVEVKEADIVTAKIPHSGTKHEGVSATCTEDGNIEYYKCSMCSQLFKDSGCTEKVTQEQIIIHATGHTTPVLVDKVDANCGNAGHEAYYKCEKEDAFWEDAEKTKPIEDIDEWLEDPEGGYIAPKGSHTTGELVVGYDAFRENDGMVSHYYCSTCKHYLDTLVNIISDDDVVIPSRLFDFTENPDDKGQDIVYTFDKPVEMNQNIVIDFKLDDVSKDSNFVSVVLYETEDTWDERYLGNFNIHGWRVEDQDGISWVCTEDGYLRVTFDLDQITRVGGNDKQVNDLEHISWVRIGAKGTTCGGKAEIRPTGDVDLYRGVHNYGSPKGGVATEERTIGGFAPISVTSTMIIDVYFENKTLTNWPDEHNIRLKLADQPEEGGWFVVGEDIKLDPNGSFINNQQGPSGVTIKKAQHVDGYVDDYYRIIIDLSKYVTEPSAKNIDLVVLDKWTYNNTYIEVSPDISSFPTSDFFDFAGKPEVDTLIGNYALNQYIDIRSGGELIDQEIKFKVKGQGTGEAYVVMQDIVSNPAAWYNCGKLVFVFTNGELTDCVIQGTANKWPDRKSLGDGVYEITITKDKFSGDGIDKAQKITTLTECKVGKGLTSFSFDLSSFRVAED